MEQIIVENLGEYIECIHKIPSEFVLSRGQEQDRPLLPSVLRLDESNMRLYSKAKAKVFIDDFKNNSLLYLDSNSANMKNDYEWLVYAQHFGVPTCLLDFTYSHLISLMFAVENAFQFDEDDDKNSVVWLLNPHKLNLASINRNDILNISNETSILDSAEYPCVVTAQKNNSRIAAQNGLFVYFQQDSTNLEGIDIASEILKKIIISHKNARKILASLYTMGMRFNNIYPELTSISKDILLKNNVLEYYKMEAENE